VRAVTEAAENRTRVRVVIGALMLVMLLAALDQTIVSTALPTIVGELGGLEHLSWVVTAYLLAVTVVTPLYGKLGDLYGRKRILQGALVLFLIGSALCGAAQDMSQLIAFRAIQGLGGGGLMVSAQAAIGDVVSPRERGRYMGLFGGMFGVASIAGPLIGGFFTTHLTWRWIFYVNLPLGAAALVALAVALPAKPERVRHAVDYAGAGLLAVALGSLILMTTLGGTTYDWGSPFIVFLAALAVVGTAAFVIVERRASEPILPPPLWRNRVFAVVAATSLVVGFALFGALTFLPLFQQVIRGLSPTASGLQLFPLMAGLLAASIASGQVISRTGRYRPFPIAGTAIATVGLVLLSGLDENTSTVSTALHMLVLGVGLGLTMQVLVLAVQNAVPYEQLGVATSGATLFRSIGGSLGTAVLGAVFATHLAARLPAGVPAEGNPAQLQRLPPAVHERYIAAFVDALGLVFTVAAVVMFFAFVLTWFLEQRTLRQTIETTGVGEAFAPPQDPSSVTELSRELGRLVGRERTREHIERTVAHAGLDLSPAQAWVLRRTQDGSALPDDEWVPHAQSELLERGLLIQADGVLVLTDHGETTADRLFEAHVVCLRELIADWPADEEPEVQPVIEALARELSAAVR
jgi:EmrB/QacA subfamily drug resistance transporter